MKKKHVNQGLHKVHQINQRKKTQGKICRHFGVADIALGPPGNTTYSRVDEQRLSSTRVMGQWIQ